MIKRLFWIGLLLVGATTFSIESAAHAGPLQQGSMLYESSPDEVALYLSDLAFVRDQVSFPSGQDIEVVLPPGTYPNTVILTENGERIHNYRITPLTQVEDPFGRFSSSATASILTWEQNEPAGADAMREVTLEYVLPGASWSPSYDMVVTDETAVVLAFFAEIRNSALALDDTTVYLVSGRVDLSEQVNQVPMVTMNQYAVGYSDETVTLPALNVGSVRLQHVYQLDTVTAAPGDMVYVNLADATLDARRMNVWNAASAQETDVIYKVINDTEIPLAEGIVRVYQDGLFVGSDYIETTPVGSEGSVTVGSLPDVRVHRTESQEYHAATLNDYYEHSVTLEIYNYSAEQIDLIVLDTWQERARGFTYSLEPEREPNNVFRWEVSIPVGETLTITYSFETDF